MINANNPVFFAPMIRLIMLSIALALPFEVVAEAGKILFVRGDVKILVGSQERVPVRGELLQEGETVITGQRSSLHARMKDGAFLAVRADTEVRIDAYEYNGEEDGTEKSFFSLLKGGFRAITGAIGRSNRENVKITTPVATIGIRGTDHEPFYVPLAGLPGVNSEPGAYDRVNSGMVVMTTEVGELLLQPGQVGFVPSATNQPVTLPTLPSFYQQPAPSDEPDDSEPAAEAPVAPVTGGGGGQDEPPPPAAEGGSPAIGSGDGNRPQQRSDSEGEVRLPVVASAVVSGPSTIV